MKILKLIVLLLLSGVLNAQSFAFFSAEYLQETDTYVMKYCQTDESGVFFECTYLYKFEHYEDKTYSVCDERFKTRSGCGYLVKKGGLLILQLDERYLTFIQDSKRNLDRYRTPIEILK